MKIQWGNILGVALLVVATAVLIKNGDAIGAFLADIGQIGQGPPDRDIKRLMAFGVVAVSVVAATRLFLSRRNDR